MTFFEFMTQGDAWTAAIAIGLAFVFAYAIAEHWKG